jgi:hypothetical protein
MLLPGVLREDNEDKTVSLAQAKNVAARFIFATRSSGGGSD